MFFNIRRKTPLPECLFNKYTRRIQLKPIFIQKEVPALAFSWQSSEILIKNFFKERKKTLLWEKKYCYKKRGSDIYRKSTYATLFVTSPRFLCFSKELAQFIVTTGCFINRKLSLKVVNHLLLSFDYPWLAKTLTGQTWLIDIYAMLPQNVLFLECFWRSHVYFIRYCNKPTEITRNHSCGRFLEN